MKLTQEDLTRLNGLAKRLTYKYQILGHDRDDYIQEMVFRVWDRIENDRVEPDDLIRFAHREMRNQLFKIERGDSFTTDPERHSRRILVEVDDSFLGYVGTKLVPMESATSPLTEANDTEEKFTSVLEKSVGLYDVDDREYTENFHWARDLIREALTRRQYQFFMIKYGEGDVKEGLPIPQVAARMGITERAAKLLNAAVKERVTIALRNRIQVDSGLETCTGGGS